MATLSDNGIVAVIGDRETVTGFLLTGIGQDMDGEQNYFIASATTPKEELEAAFRRLTGRRDVSILFINQWVASMMRETVAAYTDITPVVMEVPGKNEKIDPSLDPILSKFMRFK
ncbi:ATPase, V1 complex, subunit F, eukaryotic [Kipferlia bialata]|uniref:ATPase, V1 complex, subunit F, eukaryotic n=1 Tax=Kipferlia bialata TaxID=797122 RepID=A0A9K3GK79_9EUKA|nr:ATPase, V1 complex, subunit F, eukaryotic [Kipferlia bialata]|eukprot:g8919.t1